MRREELAEHDRLAVGHEVDAARPAPCVAASQRPSTVLSMCVVAVSWPPPPTQRKRPERDHLDDRREQRRVAAAPDEARAAPRPSRGRPHAHELLRLGLRRRVERRRVRPQRRALVDIHQRLPGHQRRLGAHVHEPPHAACAAGGDHVPRAPNVEPLEVGRVAPVLDLRGRVEGDLAVLDAEVVAGRPSPARRRARARAPRPAPSGRARARPSPRARRRSMSAPPTKPEPPVTNAVGISALVARAGPEGVADRDRAGDLGLVAERVRVAVLVGEHRLGADAARPRRSRPGTGPPRARSGAPRRSR